MEARGGVDLGGTKIQSVVVDGRDSVRGQARLPTPREGGPPAVKDAIAQAVAEAAKDAGVEPKSLRGVGVGSPGEVRASEGVVAQARNLPDWDGAYPLGVELSKQLGTKVRLGNDVDVAVWAEFKLGAAKEFGTVIGVWWGTGVGGGVILDGRQWDGCGAAGEIGHMVVKRGGRRCPCGRLGCMEAYAGRAGMEAQARKLHDEGRKTKLFKIMKERDRERLTSGVWFRAVEKGDEVAIEIVEDAIDALGNGVASACNLLDPEAVIIGGGLGTRFGEDYAQRIAKSMLPHLFADDRPPAVRVAALGDLGGAIGAALLVKAEKTRS